MFAMVAINLTLFRITLTKIILLFLFLGVKRDANGLEKEECDMSLHEGWQMIYQLLLDSLIKLGYDPSVKVCYSY